MRKLPFLISVPHASPYIPEDILVHVLPKYRAKKFRSAFTDICADKIYGIPEAEKVIVYPVCRIVADANRCAANFGKNKNPIEVTDFDEKSIYKKGYEITHAEIERRMSRYYEPYHALFERELGNPRVKFFIEGHTMGPMGCKKFEDEGIRRPLICLGNNGDENGCQRAKDIPISCPTDVAIFIKKQFMDVFGFLDEDITLNMPFSGGYLTRKFGCLHPNRKPGIQIEFNEQLYVNQKTKIARPEKIKEIKRGLRKVLRRLAREL